MGSLVTAELILKEQGHSERFLALLYSTLNVLLCKSLLIFRR